MKRGADSEPGGKKSEAGKSELTVLAEKFKEQFCREADIARDVNLNSVADNLQVSRRRLYDIVNVLEALQMVSRSGKLTYRWEGMTHLPRLLAMLYSDALAGAERGQSNPAILEGRMPGSCWALTRRIVQQLLIDRSQVPLTLLVQRLEAAPAPNPGDNAAAAAAAASSSGKTSLATVERRIYDIGSVLSTFGLVSKTMQGGSGPRHRQPVYQWLLDWESQLPAETLQAVYQEAATAATVATAAPEAVPAPDHGGAAVAAGGQDSLLQQWQSSQPPLASVAAAHQQQRSGPLAGEPLLSQQQPHYAAGHVQHELDLQQQASSAATAALQQRLQKLNQLVNTVLVQHGEKTCVTLSQLKDLLQQVETDEPLQRQPAAANSTAQQQVAMSEAADSSSKDTSSDDQEQLDAAECLQQLRAGSVAERQRGSKQLAKQRDSQQQQSFGEASMVEDATNASDERSPKKQKCLGDAEQLVPQSEDQCCPGMTCFDLGAALRAAAAAAVAGDTGQQAAGQQSQQLASTAAIVAGGAAVHAGMHRAERSNDIIDEQTHDYAEFTAEEGEEAPGVRVGSNTLNNSREGTSFQELAAAAVASLQQQQHGYEAGVSGGVQADRSSNQGQEQHHDSGSAAAASAEQQQQGFQAVEPWLHSNADRSTAAAVAAAEGMHGLQSEAGLQWLWTLLQAVQGTQAEHSTVQLLTQLLLGQPAAAGSQGQQSQHEPLQAAQQAQQQQQQQHAVGDEHLQLAQMLQAMSASQPTSAVFQQLEQQQHQQQHALLGLESAHVHNASTGILGGLHNEPGGDHASATGQLQGPGAVHSGTATDQQDWLYSLLGQHHPVTAAAPATAADGLASRGAVVAPPSTAAAMGHTTGQLDQLTGPEAHTATAASIVAAAAELLAAGGLTQGAAAARPHAQAAEVVHHHQPITNAGGTPQLPAAGLQQQSVGSNGLDSLSASMLLQLLQVHQH